MVLNSRFLRTIVSWVEGIAIYAISTLQEPR